jgi:hypothetical protein
MASSDGAAVATRGNGRPRAIGLTSLAAAAQELRRPFTAEATEFLCIAAYRPRSGPGKAVVAPYVARMAVEKRLDEVVGAENWWVAYRESNPGEFSVVCSLTVFEVTKESYGRGETSWSQEANSFKRAARLFGVGRYLAEMRPVHLEIGDGAHQVQPRGKGHVVSDTLAAKLREQLAERVEVTYVERYGRPLDLYDEPGQLSDEGEFGEQGASTPEEGPARPSAGSPQATGAAQGAMQAVSRGPGSDSGAAPAPPQARTALAQAIDRAGYGSDTVASACRLFYGTSISDRLGEEQLSEMCARLDAATTGGVKEGTFKGQVTRASQREDRDAARRMLDSWILRRANEARAQRRYGDRAGGGE